MRKSEAIKIRAWINERVSQLRKEYDEQIDLELSERDFTAMASIQGRIAGLGEVSWLIQEGGY